MGFKKKRSNLSVIMGLEEEETGKGLKRYLKKKIMNENYKNFARHIKLHVKETE